jgi:hypothetical protein
MKFVVDSNYLQSDELSYFLRKSNKNIVVLTDFVAMEAYKSNIYKSMELLSQFAYQVIVLKGSTKIGSLCGRPKGLQRRLIDELQTKEFSEYIKTLSLSKKGNPRILNQVQSNNQLAQNHLEKMLQDAERIKPEIDNIAKIFTKDEKAIIRDNQPFSTEMVKKLGEAVITITAGVLHTVSNAPRRPAYDELPNTFYFRVTLCCFLMLIRRGALGGASDARIDKIRNDVVDMIIVAYATYFDGILSKETNVNRIFEDACAILSGLFGAVVPSLARRAEK